MDKIFPQNITFVIWLLHLFHLFFFLIWFIGLMRKLKTVTKTEKNVDGNMISTWPLTYIIQCKMESWNTCTKLNYTNKNRFFRESFDGLARFDQQVLKTCFIIVKIDNYINKYLCLVFLLILKVGLNWTACTCNVIQTMNYVLVHATTLISRLTKALCTN